MAWFCVPILSVNTQKLTLFKKCFHFMFVHNGTMSYVFSAQRVYVQLFTSHSLGLLCYNYYYLCCVCTSVDSFDSSDNTNKNKWKSTFLKSYKFTRPIVIKLNASYCAQVLYIIKDPISARWTTFDPYVEYVKIPYRTPWTLLA